MNNKLLANRLEALLLDKSDLFYKKKRTLN